MRTLLASLLLVIGTIVATAGFARTQPQEPGWEQKTQIHLPAALGGLVLMLTAIALRQTARTAQDPQTDSSRGDDQRGFSLEAARASLQEACRQLSELENGTDGIPDPDTLERIATDQLEPVIDGRRQAMELLGPRRYAELFGAIAEAERWLNRAWSASVDGYATEARQSLANARRDLETALSLIHAWTAGPSA